MPATAVRAGALGCALFLTACLVPGGLLTGRRPADVALYQRYGEALLGGTLPYRDFFAEYPPGALAAFVVPALAPADDFTYAFKALMIACGLAAIVLVALCLRGRRAYAAAAFAALAPLALGPTVLERYDLWPAALTAGALAALVAGRPLLGLAVLGAATAAKGYPLVLLPLALLFAGRELLRRGLAVFAAVVAAVFLPFALLAPGGVGYSLSVQLRRPLQVESLGGGFLLALDRAGAYSAEVATSYGSQNLAGGAARGLAVVTGLAALAALATVWWGYASGARTAERLLLASAAAVAGLVAFGKVLSPQFLIWLVPLVPLAAGAAGIAAGGLLLAALALTNAWFPERYSELVHGGGEAWLVLARGLALVALYAVLAATVWSTASRSERT